MAIVIRPAGGINKEHHL